MVKPIAPNGAQSAYRYQSAWRSRGYSAISGDGEETRCHGHSRVFALLNTDIMVRPVTLCVSKVSVTESKYTSILMGTVQFAIANGVLDVDRKSVV